MSKLDDKRTPAHRKPSFECPRCGGYSAQGWNSITLLNPDGTVVADADYLISTCSLCRQPLIWHRQQVVYPRIVAGPKPHDAMPIGIAVDFEEARKIAVDSPRGAGALLRLCVQKLCQELGEPGKNINDDIQKLVAKGLSIQIQQALDVVRVVGNNAVHPGELDLRDDLVTVSALFNLLNHIVETLIAEPKRIADLYARTVSESKQQEIAKRDQPKK